MINNMLYALMVQRGLRPAIMDLSPGLRSRGPAYHAVRTARAGSALLRILGAALSRRRRRYVLHLDGGTGLVYNIALALATHPLAEARGLLARLIDRRQGWVTAHVLNALGGYGDPDALPLIRQAWAAETHEFVRVMAVRAAGMAARV